MRILGSNELMNDVVKRELCIGCGMCVGVCPYFKNYKGKTAILFPCTLSRGRCYANCPKASVDLDALSRFYWNKPYDGAPLGRFKRILAARAGADVTGRFQGGGVVSSLVGYALARKRADAAVLTGAEGIEPVPRLVTDPARVADCAGSKFIAAPTLVELNRAAREGVRRLAVVGTPCQMTAVAQMRTNPLELGDFEDPVALTIGLFCNWALDHRNLTAYLSERLDITAITGMDIPPPPADALVVNAGGSEHRFPLEEIRPLIPHTCFICPDMTAEWADLSVGMYEGRPGWNTLLVRTEAAEELVDAAVSEGELIVEDFPDANREALSTAALAKKVRSLRNAARKELLQEENERGRPTLRLPPETLERLLG